MNYSISYVSIGFLQKIFFYENKPVVSDLTKLNFMDDIILIKENNCFCDFFSASENLINAIRFNDLTVYNTVLMRCYIVAKEEIEIFMPYEEFKTRYI